MTEVEVNMNDELVEENKTPDEVSTDSRVDNSEDGKENDISCDVIQEDESKSTPDPFAYVKQNGFTSEIFKIEIRGLPRFYGLGEFRKLLNFKLQLECNKVKAPGRRSAWLYACFRSEEQRNKAIEVLSGFKWKGSVLSAKPADPAPDPLMKRRLEDISDDSSNKKQKISSLEEQKEALLKSAAPLWNVPYKEQISRKTEDAKALIRKLGVELVRHNPSLKQWIQEQKKLNDGLPCKLLSTRCLEDNYNDYRNKCEFTIGKDELTGEKRVGFRLGSYASGSLGVAPVDELPIIPKVVKEAAKAFEKFVQKSDLEVFSPEDLSGYWRQLTVRYGVGTGEMMLIVGFNPQAMSSDEITTIKNKIKEYYEFDETVKNSVTSLYFQEMKRKEKGTTSPEYDLLLGNKYIEEKLCGLRFKISPESFFQINTLCAEVLMESVRELSNVDSDKVLLDVCCGTGTIGLCLAKDSARVLGIEIVQQAVKAAQENAEKNNITNCEFFCGKADEIFTSVINRIPEEQEAVAILDPPRAGLHQKAILMLRRAKNLKKLVFLSCDSKAALKNFIELGRAQSKTLAGDPFLPVSAVVVDMFPHTNHYELVLYFERIDISKKVESE